MAEQYPLLFRVNEACKTLKLGRSRLYKGIRDGEIPVVDVCGIKRIPADWIQAKIKEALDTVATNSEKPAA
jgi:excisionase family DNA binding protein